MLTIGCHLSVSKGFTAMGRDALLVGGNTMQFFSRNPRGTKAKPIDEIDIASFLDLCKAHQFGKLLCHAPYILNGCSADPDIRKLARETMADDLRRMEYLPGNLYNFHPGSHVKQGAEAGIEMIADMLNQILNPELHTTVLLETMAGKGTEVGRNFEELAAIIDRVECKELMGVCMDTCHVHDGGYDIVNDLDGVLDELDQVIGLDRLKAIHMNDSKNPKGAHKDRHEKIGEGYIGQEALIGVMNNPRLKGLPIFLETPNELSGYAKEIQLLKHSYLE